MDRRRFLTTTALGVTALALNHKNAFAAASTGFSPLISIGFAPALPANGTAVRLTDAASILMPDPTFLSRGARVTVAGSARAAKHASDPGGGAGTVAFAAPAVATSGIDFVARRMRETTKKEETAATAPADVDPARSPRS